MEKIRLITHDGDSSAASDFEIVSPLVAYNVHLSNLGWLGEVSDGDIGGATDKKYPVEAMKIRVEGLGGDISCQVFYNDSGWSQPSSRGALAGSTGQARPIHGFRIWLDGEPSRQIEYRAYTDEWSDWKMDGEELKSASGFRAVQIRLGEKMEAKPGDELKKDSGPAAPIASPFPVNASAKRLNRLAKMRGAKNYLEIGVWRGDTFRGVKVDSKTGVDPDFKFDIATLQKLPGIYLMDMKSDEFFEDYDNLCKDIYKSKPRFDLVYIDGLHTFAQATADFLNSQPFCHRETIWVFDDTIPSDPWSAIPDKKKSLNWRALYHLKGQPWHGDVFKCVMLLHDFYPYFSYATVIDGGNPQTVAWQTQSPAKRKAVWGDLAAIARLQYFDILDNFQLFNPVKDIDLEKTVGRVFEDAPGDVRADFSSIIKPIV